MITVVKTRASYHDPAVREFTITDAGIVLSDEPEPATARAVRAHRPESR